MSQFKIINGIKYNIDELIDYQPTGSDIRTQIHAYLVQPGYNIFVGDKLELVYDVEYKNYLTNNKSFYFLHIEKTGGMSIKLELLNAFKNNVVFSNFIQYIDKEKMISSDFISGHFALYPLELFNKNKKELITYTILRDPVNRFLSNFLYYKKRIIDVDNYNELDLLESYIYDSNNQNIQYKSLTNTLNEKLLTDDYKKMLEDNSLIKEYYKNISNHKYFVESSDNIYDTIDKINYIEILELRKNFKKLEDILLQFNIKYTMNNNNFNTSDGKTEELKNNIPKSLLKNIVDLNKKDYEIYEYCIKNRKAG